MATTKLEIYQGALLLAGQRFLSSVSEAVEARYLLDHVYDARGREACLEKADWNFAQRTVKIDYDTATSPSFGFTYAFDKPTDFVTLSAISSDENFRETLLNYTSEAAYWYANIQSIYVSYVSNHADYGLDFSKWPDSFTEYVKAYFAGQIVQKLTTDGDRYERLYGPPGFPKRGLIERRLGVAKNRDAKGSPTRFPEEGNWNRSRRGSYGSSRRDRGNTGNLIG